MTATGCFLKRYLITDWGDKVNKLVENLQNLALLPGLAGHEQKVATYMKNYFEELGLPVTVDVLGNTIATVQGTDPKTPSILVTAHMDQLGFVVKRIEDDGFLRLERVGGIPEKILPALRVQVQTRSGDMVEGVIGVKSHHLTLPEEKYKVEPYRQLYVDLGCRSRAEVLELGIEVGSPVVYKPSFERLAGTLCSGTSFDNRVACALALDLAERLSKEPAAATVHIAGTVQEEYTIRGAVLAARATNPAIAICLDVTMDTSTPDLKGTGEVELGRGPAISLYNFHGRGTLNGTIPHPALVRLFENTAKAEGINLQRVAALGGLTELSYMQVEGEGIAGIDFDVPCRYTHTPIETVDLNDMKDAANLLEAVIRAVTPDFSLARI